MKRIVGTRTLITSLGLIGAGLVSYPGRAAAAAPDEGAQGLARALLAPPVRAAAWDVGAPARAGQRVSAPDAVQLAQRFISGAADGHAGPRGSSAVSAGTTLRSRLAERRHDGDLHELIRRTILGQRV